MNISIDELTESLHPWAPKIEGRDLILSRAYLSGKILKIKLRYCGPNTFEFIGPQYKFQTAQSIYVWTSEKDHPEMRYVRSKNIVNQVGRVLEKSGLFTLTGRGLVQICTRKVVGFNPRLAIEEARDHGYRINYTSAQKREREDYLAERNLRDLPINEQSPSGRSGSRHRKRKN